MVTSYFMIIIVIVIPVGIVMVTVRTQFFNGQTDYAVEIFNED